MGTKKTSKRREDGKKDVGLSSAALAKRMGSKRGYSPMPPAQHTWQAEPGEAPLHRMWSELTKLTVLLGHRCPYAVDELGHEIHVEHLAERLGMDLPNAYHYWRLGLTKGLWRNGKKEEGRRRLYLCGELAPQQIGEEKPNPIVCTYNFPASINKQIKDWAPERITNLGLRIVAIEKREKEVTAVLMAAKRSMFEQVKDTAYSDEGLEITHQDHQKKDETPEEATERRARAKLLVPALEKYVQTVFVDPIPGSVHINNSAPASLLVQSKPRDKPLSSSSASVATPVTTNSISVDQKKGWVREAMEPTCGFVEDIVVEGIIKGAEAKAPGITPSEIAEAVRDRALKITARTKNPSGFLLTAVHNLVSPAWLAKHRGAKDGLGAGCTCGQSPHLASCAKYSVSRGSGGE